MLGEKKSENIKGTETMSLTDNNIENENVTQFDVQEDLNIKSLTSNNDNSDNNNDQDVSPSLLPLIDGNQLPVTMGLEVINRCNVSCKMCHGAQIYKTTGAFPPLKIMKFEEIKHLFKNMKIGGLTLEGYYSEPTMHPEFIEIAKFVKSKGGIISVITNGMLINKERAKQMVDIGFNNIFLSLHGGSKDVAEDVMEGANFNRIVENMKHLNRLKQQKGAKCPNVIIMFIAMRRNFQDLPKLIEIGHQIGASKVMAKPVKRPGDNSSNVLDLSWWKTENLADDPKVIAKYYFKAVEEADRLGVALELGEPYRSIAKSPINV